MSKNNKGAGKKNNLSFSSLNRFMIIQFVLMIVLSLGVTSIINKRAKINAQQHLSAVTDERAQIIINYVENSEKLLDAFSKSPEVRDIILTPTDKDLSAKVQKYTADVTSSIPGADSLFVCDFSAKVLSHSKEDSIGTSISNERLDELQKALRKLKKNEEDGQNTKPVYVYGVTKSSSTGEVTINMYKGIFDNDIPLGFVGLAIKSEDLIDKLQAMETVGLENSFYSMIDVSKRVYVFDQDLQQSAEPLVIPDLLRQCDLYGDPDNNEPVSTTYEFVDPTNGKSCVGASYYIRQYNWLLMMNDETSEVYTLARTMKIFLGVFSVLIIAMMVLFAFLNKKQEKVNRKLLSSVEAVNETKKSLNTAMFGDILTGVGNRVKLATDLMGINDGKTNPYYFALFNIMEFSNINTAYGSDTGDALLVRIAETLKQQFPNGEVYRTGSDEFVVMMKTRNNSPQMSDVLFNVDEALKRLLVPENVRGLGTLYPKYKVAAIKKSTDIDASVITILKEMTNVKGEAMCGMIDFVDMSE